MKCSQCIVTSKIHITSCCLLKAAALSKCNMKGGYDQHDSVVYYLTDDIYHVDIKLVKRSSVNY